MAKFQAGDRVAVLEASANYAHHDLLLAAVASAPRAVIVRQMPVHAGEPPREPEYELAYEDPSHSGRNPFAEERHLHLVERPQPAAAPSAK